MHETLVDRVAQDTTSMALALRLPSRLLHVDDRVQSNKSIGTSPYLWATSLTQRKRSFPFLRAIPPSNSDLPPQANGRCHTRIHLEFFNLTHPKHRTRTPLSYAIFEVGYQAWCSMEASIAPSSWCGLLLPCDPSRPRGILGRTTRNEMEKNAFSLPSENIPRPPHPSRFARPLARVLRRF